MNYELFRNFACKISMNRINWIDWGKAIAVVTVVFCHLPQSQEWFYYRYLQACIITVFFFISGYLKKDREDAGSRWSKYWRSLIKPYVIFNLLFYPYWLLKFYMKNDGMPSMVEAVMPLVKSVLLQPVDGPLWYLPAILIMHLIVDVTRKMRYFHPIMIALCVASFFLYAANKYWVFAPGLVPMGVFRRLPYYYIGYVMGRKLLFREVQMQRDALICVSCFFVSFLLFYWHLHEGNYLMHIILFYAVNITFLFAVVSGCKLLNGYVPRFVLRLSTGTLVIIGLHFILITIANYLVAQVLHTGNICYHWYEALPLSLLLVLILYPAILLIERYYPSLIGR